MLRPEHPLHSQQLPVSLIVSGCILDILLIHQLIALRPMLGLVVLHLRHGLVGVHVLTELSQELAPKPLGEVLPLALDSDTLLVQILRLAEQPVVGQRGVHKVLNVVTQEHRLVLVQIQLL